MKGGAVAGRAWQWVGLLALVAVTLISCGGDEEPAYKQMLPPPPALSSPRAPTASAGLEASFEGWSRAEALTCRCSARGRSSSSTWGWRSVQLPPNDAEGMLLCAPRGGGPGPEARGRAAHS